MTHGVETFVRLSPAVWPGGPLGIQPGDLSQFAPMGNGVGALLVVMPWGGVASLASQKMAYGFHPPNGHPFSGAPITEAGGGVVYFDRRCQRADVEAMARLVGVNGHLKRYAAFVQDASTPDDRYVTQMRIVSDFALKFMFHAPQGPELDALIEQPLTIGEALWRFIEHFCHEHEKRRYPLHGKLGGDGDCAWEALGFGFMVENEYHSIYRVWTRAWLVTK